MRALCIAAAVCLLGLVALGETGHPLWMQAACMVQCALWCVLAGLYETASNWQREASYWQRSRDAKIAQLLEEDASGLSEADGIDMTGALSDIAFATEEEATEAFFRELGGK